MANTIDDKVDYRNKIEAEYRKPATEQNANLINFWREQLDKLEAQPQGKQFHSIELSSK
jgi:hypothetical protein